MVEAAAAANPVPKFPSAAWADLRDWSSGASKRTDDFPHQAKAVDDSVKRVPIVRAKDLYRKRY